MVAATTTKNKRSKPLPMQPASKASSIERLKVGSPSSWCGAHRNGWTTAGPQDWPRPASTGLKASPSAVTHPTTMTRAFTLRNATPDVCALMRPLPMGAHQGAPCRVMPAQREATCPECGDVRVTAAQPRTPIACLGCGGKFRAPPVEISAGPAPVEGAGAPVLAAGPAPAPLQRASATKVRQRARPRARGEGGRFVASTPPPPPADPPPPPPASQPKAKRAGARGGRGYYQDRVVRRAG